MNTAQAQIKLNLPAPLLAYLRAKAEKYGMPVAGYVKHLILADVEDVEYPVFEMSERTKKNLEKALAEDGYAYTNKVGEEDKIVIRQRRISFGYDEPYSPSNATHRSAVNDF